MFWRARSLGRGLLGDSAEWEDGRSIVDSPSSHVPFQTLPQRLEDFAFIHLRCFEGTSTPHRSTRNYLDHQSMGNEPQVHLQKIDFRSEGSHRQGSLGLLGCFRDRSCCSGYQVARATVSGRPCPVGTAANRKCRRCPVFHPNGAPAPRKLRCEG